MKSTSALPPGASKTFGDDFAAMLAGLAPRTQSANGAPHPPRERAASDCVAQMPAPDAKIKPDARPALAIARQDSKPAARPKAQPNADPSAARASGTSKSAAANSPREDSSTSVSPVAQARAAGTAPPTNVAEAKAALSSGAPELSADVATFDANDKSGAEAAQSAPQAGGANGKAIPAQAFAEIVAAAKEAAPAPDGLLKAPAAALAQAAASAGKSAKDAKDAGGATLRVSVTMKDTAPAPPSVVTDKTVRALSDIAANESRVLEQAEKSDTNAGGDASPRDNGDGARTDVPDRAAQAAVKADPAPAEAPLPTAPPSRTAPAGGQNVPVMPPAAPIGALTGPAGSANPTAQAAPSGAGAEVPTNVTDLAAVIAARSAGGAKSFEIRLDPAELGRVEVQLNVGHDGKVDASIVAHRPETLALLLSDSQNLERALKDAGLDVSNSSLNFSLKGEERQGDGGGASTAHTRNLPDAVVARSEAANASIASLGLAPSSARLDIRV